MRDPA
jgi:immunoglobulin-binding protein 1